MADNSAVRYAKLKLALTRGGATEKSVKSSHHNWKYRGDNQSIPVHSNRVKARYVVRLRKAWKLHPKDGVSDKDFWNGDWDKAKEPPS